MSFIDRLKWRYATKKFDTSKKLSTQQLQVLLESVNLAATSQGLQPFKLFVVENEAVRRHLSAAANDQPQVLEASQVLIFAAKTNISKQYLDDYIGLIGQIRGIPLEELESNKARLHKSVLARDPENIKNWTTRQAYLALGFLLSAAAVEGIDACPMEGFNAQKFNEILGLDSLELSAVVMATVGFRSPHDSYASLQKVRKELSDLVVWI
jgi:nitroreductase / dihydropteridine reductase